MVRITTPFRIVGAASLVMGLAGCAAAGIVSPPDVAAPAASTIQADPAKVSAFGEYSGYSKQLYDEWVSNSEYITTRDGTRLAVDISRPAVNGVAVDTPYPVIWTYSRYHRRTDGTRWIDQGMAGDAPYMQDLVKHGYVIAVVNVRGGGASFGRYEGLFSAKETRDAYDVIDWFSKQPWSNGNVGMIGLSYMGITQYMAASTGHPALKAIMPENGYFNFYDAARTGGISRADMIKTWGDGTRYLDLELAPAPVDADTDGALAAQAVQEHQGNFDPISPLGQSKYRDSTFESFDWYKDMPSAVMGKINQSGVAIYHMGGWFDPYTQATLTMFRNHTGPKKLVMGPWPHVPANQKETEEKYRVIGAESMRWFDYWLKGIDNHVMESDPVHISIVDRGQESWSWRAFDRLPVDTPASRYFFTNERSGSTSLPDDRRLARQEPKQVATIAYKVDPETTTYTATRWDSNFGTPVVYPDMTDNDRRSLTFTTDPFDRDVTLLGAPVLSLRASSSAQDMDVYALIEEVSPGGHSQYVSEGMLRASLRKTAQPMWDNLGLPWFPARKQDEQMLTPGEPVDLTFNIIPTAHLINRGNRLRIVIMGADKDNTEAPPHPDAIIDVMTGGLAPSWIDLPLEQ